MTQSYIIPWRIQLLNKFSRIKLQLSCVHKFTNDETETRKQKEDKDDKDLDNEDENKEQDNEEESKK